ncbi:MAG TPA: ABC transporter permease [Candidatus Elarobacter sp.]|nr:ABC transporter permease [Candidatus Elarobacter sp.]
MIGSLLQDIRYGIRTLGKNPGFTAVAVLTLALGIGANTAIFSVVENVLLRPLPYPQPGNLVQIWNTYPPQAPRAGLSPGDYADWRQQNASFSEMGGYAHISQGFNLTGEGEPQRVLGSYASAGLFPLLGIHLAAGHYFVEEEDRAGSSPVVILSHQLWQSRFGGDPAVVGRTITLDNQRYRVTGVLPADFRLLRWPDLWMPFGQYGDDLTEHVHHSFIGVARLKPGVTLAQARDEMARLNQQETIQYPDSHKFFGVLVEPMEDPSAAKLQGILLVLSGAVGLVLLIACGNIVNLLLVRNAGREREVAVRTALGASSWQLSRQLLTESMLLSLAGSALGLILAVGGLRFLMAFVPADLGVLRESGLNSKVLAFTAAVCVATGIICGLLPALRTFRANLAGVLKQGSKGTSGTGHRRTHNVLVISEIAMALVLLIGAGLLLRSFQHLLEVDPGFRVDHILTVEVQQAALPFTQASKLSQEDWIQIGQKQSLQFEQIVERIRALPGVKEAAGIDDLPLSKEFRQASRFVIEDQPIPNAGARPIVQFRTVSLSYFSTMGIPLRKGRLFTEDDWRVPRAVINETMERRFWPKGDALGKRINLCSLDPKPCWSTIIGVTGNVHQFGLDAEPTFDVYFVGGWTPYVVVRTASDPVALAAAVTDVIHKADSNLPVTHVMTMDGLLTDTISPRRFSATLVGVFAVLAVVLAAVGIYGVMSYTVSQRTQEIGVRMALGAQLTSVRRMILGQTLKLTLMGVALGLAGAFVVARFLTSLLFGVGVYDPLTFLGVAVLLVAVALAASYVPARRAMRVHPIVALRYE